MLPQQANGSPRAAERQPAGSRVARVQVAVVNKLRRGRK